MAGVNSLATQDQLEYSKQRLNSEALVEKIRPMVEQLFKKELSLAPTEPAQLSNEGKLPEVTDLRILHDLYTLANTSDPEPTLTNPEDKGFINEQQRGTLDVQYSQLRSRELKADEHRDNKPGLSFNGEKNNKPVRPSENFLNNLLGMYTAETALKLLQENTVIPDMGILLESK